MFLKKCKQVNERRMTHGDNRRQIAKGQYSDSDEPGDIKIEGYMLCVITYTFGLFIVLPLLEKQ